MPVETSGRFIEDEDSRRKVDRAGDCHDVLDRDGIAAEQSGHVDVESISIEQSRGPPLHFAVADNPEQGRLPAAFSPRRAWISPARSVKSTSSSARSDAKLLESPRISKRDR